MNVRTFTASFALGTALVLGLSEASLAQLTYYGYYEQDDGRFGHFGPETYSHTNYIHLAPLSHDFFKQRIGQAAVAGQRVVLDMDAFFKSRPEATWDADFPDYANIVKPYLNHIAAVFVVDEPFTSNGSFPSPGAFTTAQVEHMISVVNTNLPGAKTLINFIPSSTDHWARPSNLDYVGTTNYPWYSPNDGNPINQTGPQDYSQFQSSWNATVGKVRAWAGGKSMWVVGAGAQGVPGNLPNPPYGALLAYPTAPQAQWYQDILSTPANSDVVGFSWYTYTNEYTVGYGSANPANEAYSTGSREAPAAVRNFQRNWGASIADLPNLGAVHVERSKFETPGAFSGATNTGFGIKSNAWFASPVNAGSEGYNISGISLKHVGGTIPSQFTLKLYDIPANSTSNKPSDGTLLVSKQFNNVSFNLDDTFTFLPLDAPIKSQAGRRYIMEVQSNNGNIWYLWGKRNPGSGSAFSSNQGGTWSTTFPDQGFFTPYNDANIEFKLWGRDDLNPVVDIRQDGETHARSLERTDWVGQSFSPGQNNISGFAFGGASGNGLNLNGGTIRARLYNASAGGTPTGAPIVSMNVSPADLGGIPWIDFGRSIPVTPGQKFVATLEAVGAGITGDWLVFYATSSPLSNFQGYHSSNQGTSWVPISGPEDWKFRTFFTPQFFHWKTNGNGNWSDDTKWVGGIPDTLDAIAHFGSVINAARSISVDGPHSVGAIEFDNTNSYSLTGSATITMDTSFGAPAIRVYRGSHSIAAPIHLAKSTGVNVSQLADVLTLSGDMTSSNDAWLVKEGPGRLDVKHVRVSELMIVDGTVKVLPNSTSTGASLVEKLAIAGGVNPTAQLDLTDNGMAIDYTGASPLAEVVAWILSGRAGGTWTGDGIATTASVVGKAIGYAEASEVGSPAVFLGLNIDSTTVLLRQTVFGDSDLDGDVDLSDLSNLAASYGQGAGAAWNEGDFDYDGDVDLNDLSSLATYYGSGEAQAFADFAALASVPEPALLSLLPLAGLMSVSRRRRVK